MNVVSELLEISSSLAMPTGSVLGVRLPMPAKITAKALCLLGPFPCPLRLVTSLGEEKREPRWGEENLESLRGEFRPIVLQVGI